MRLKDKVAVITGSNRGIGRGIALAMAKEGADIAINYRSHKDEAEAVAAQIKALGRRVIVQQADVSDRAAVDKLIARTVDELGRVDICVCNAARTVHKPFLNFTNEDMNAVLSVTLMGVFNAGQAAARQMVKQGDGGSILVISSVHAFIPFAGSTAYNTCKGGINNMAHTMAEELCPHRIRVNILEPGWIDTPGEHVLMNSAELLKAGKKLPWGRLGTEAEMGKTAAFLCSDDASYITAANLRADGGFWLPSRGA